MRVGLVRIVQAQQIVLGVEGADGCFCGGGAVDVEQVDGAGCEEGVEIAAGCVSYRGGFGFGLGRGVKGVLELVGFRIWVWVGVGMGV